MSGWAFWTEDIQRVSPTDRRSRTPHRSPGSLRRHSAPAAPGRFPTEAVREGCCRLLDHLVDTDSMDELITMVDDPDARVRVSAFHALACDRCKGDTCAPGADRVLGPAVRHLASDPDPHVRSMAVELVGKFAHTDDRAVAALRTSQAQDPSPAVRKKAGRYAPGGTVYERTVPRSRVRTA
ncbi:HEAT repeat domain-containing protein [Streptomyces galbus]|uniref:HEAT repeat domain-containing protein n=2 Tax=Streptomyces galbus TaxID=33898 RepID=A0A4U5WA85_STRGB|nr:HEAT repeat domain-containing protein [Streptomyces galbus]